VLRLNLGGLVRWEGAEYTVAASTGAATLLYRLADGQRVWVDVATLAAGDLSLRPTAAEEITNTGAAGPVEPLDHEQSKQALWW
jgi:hypothetical protein